MNHSKLEKIFWQQKFWDCPERLKNLSNAFDCVICDLVIAKLHTYGLLEDAMTFLNSNLKRRKQGLIINGTESFFQILLSGVLQGSIKASISFNIFINDLFLFIKDVKLANFAVDNLIYPEKLT